MYEGYLQLGGTEIINAARTAAYVKNNAPGIPLRETVDLADLRVALGDDPYESPLVDDAPWSDESNPATQRFYGLYPLTITGDQSSTRQAPITEGILDGGTVGQVRRGSREILVRGLLIARDQLALDAGRAWLERALDPSPCGEHGGTCTGATCCYYAAAPIVDPNAVDWDAPITSVHSFGRLEADTSPLIHRLARPGPAKATWTFERADGVVLQYGAFAVGAQDEIFASPEIALQRTNYIVDPSFERAQNWWKVDADGLYERILEGGANGGAYANLRRIYPSVPTTTRTNYAAIPGADFDPAAGGWTSNTAVLISALDSSNTITGSTIYAAHSMGSAAFGDNGYGLSPYGGSGFGTEGYGQGNYGSGVTVASGDISTDPITVLIPILGPSLTATTGRVSVWLGESPDAQFVRILDYNGVTLAEQLVPPITTDFQRIDLTGPITTGGYVEVGTTSSPTQGVRIMAVLVEEGTGAYGTHFHGDSTDTDTTRYSYQGSPYVTPSVELTGDFTTFTFTSGPTSSPSGPSILTLQLRSVENAEVLVEVLSADDGTIYSSATYRVTPDWETYPVAAAYSRNVVVRLTAFAHFDVDEVMLEMGNYQMPYFDGSSVPATGYEISWIGGTVGAAASRMIWTGTAMYQRDNERWRPFVRVIHGSLPSSTLTLEQYGTVPVEKCAAPYERQFHDTTCISGPRELETLHLSSGILMRVEFILLAGSPTPFGTTRLLTAAPIADLDWDTFVDTAPPAEPVSVIVDPSCPPLPAPPRPPSVPDVCIDDPPASWRRHWLTIPGAEIAAWSSTVPTITLNTLDDPVRQVRVRFHPNPFNFPAEEVDPHSYCSEFILSYLPSNTEIVFDGMVQRAAASVAGKPTIPANNLLYGTGGSPMTWPELSCGISYVMTIDIPGSTVPDASVELSLTRKE